MTIFRAGWPDHDTLDLPGLPPPPAPVSHKDAVLSPDEKYRYWLERTWAPGEGRAVFVMLNPSTADADLDDPTIRRCKGFARTWGLGALIVVNLYGLRSTDPAGLWTVDDPVGEANDSWLEVAATIAARNDDPVVAAWGVNARPDRVSHVTDLFARFGAPLQALGVTVSGQPRHPLYLRGDAPLAPWSMP